MLSLIKWAFSGISTFAHLPHIRCLSHPETKFDIGIIGAPFDTAVSYRPGKWATLGPHFLICSKFGAQSSSPYIRFKMDFNRVKPLSLQLLGARFGPRAIRAGSSRQTSFRGFNSRANLNPYSSWAKIVDCGDMPITPFDNDLALRQMSEAYIELGSRLPTQKSISSSTPYLHKPKLLTLGGDHSIALPALRA